MKGVSNIQDLKSWFYAQPNNYWTLYRGHVERKEGSRVIARNEKLNNREEAWEMLESAIGIQSVGGGKFTILATPQVRGNTGFTTFLTLVDPTKPAAVNGLTQTPGIYGTNVDRLLDKERARTEDMVHMQRDIEDLEAQLKVENQSESTIGKIFDMAINNPEGFGKAIAGITQAVVVGISAFRNPGAAPAVAGTHHAPPAPPPVSSGEIRPIEDSIVAIAQYFPPEEFLSMLSSFIQANPQQAQMFFQQFQMQQQSNDND